MRPASSRRGHRARRRGTAWPCSYGWRSYPTITLLLAVTGPLVADWPLPLRTLLLTVIAVPLMVFVLLPRLQRVMAPWLAR